MTNRIRRQDLENLVSHINKRTNSPGAPWTHTKEDKLKANIGNYHLSWAYGGVQLVRMGNKGGGISVISTIGFGTKRELYNWLQAFIRGLDTAKTLQEA